MMTGALRVSDSAGMHLEGYWHTFMADAGNAPGAQQGDVVVTLIKPVGGIEEIRVPSDLVSLAAEVGNLIGVQLMTADGRHLFVAAGNLAGIVDAPPISHKSPHHHDPDDGGEHGQQDAAGAQDKTVARRAGK
jgi:hypothetical protein